MGPGAGVNAVLADPTAREVLAVDVAEGAVPAARANVERNGLADRVTVRRSDVFSAVDGRFDLVVGRSALPVVPSRGRPGGDHDRRGLRRAGPVHRRRPLPPDRPGPGAGRLRHQRDLTHLRRLADWAGFAEEVLRRRELVRDELSVEYVVLRWTPRRPG
ncbi:Ribosomal protein L11 methyltransferase (PrmA) [Modestobacter sp. DSM 44400]|nr:Ribosomal protein L11 methyltransferase (PrmA) [Modestobacter sp. DSM 44400]